MNSSYRVPSGTFTSIKKTMEQPMKMDLKLYSTTGVIHTYTIDRHTTIFMIKQIIQLIHGFRIDELRIVARGMKDFNNNDLCWTTNEYKAPDGQLFHYHLIFCLGSRPSPIENAEVPFAIPI